MTNKNAILDQTNPVYNTAKLTLSILGNAGVPEAQAYAEKLGFIDFRKSFDVNSENKSDLPQAILHESRYEFLNRVIRETGCKNIVDIACGFSPRGYVMAKAGYNYLGLDLEASVEALSNLANEFQNENLPGSLRYAACDLTNPEAFEKLLDEVEGELIIVCEGLWMYLQPFEAKRLCEGIMNVLKKHGGKYITPDFTYSDIFVAAHFALLGQEEGMKVIMEMSKATAQKSNTNFTESLVAPSGSPKARKLYEDMGFEIEMIPYFTETETMYIWDKMDAEAAMRVRGALSTMQAWSVTVGADAASAEETSENVPFSVSCSLEDENLNVTLCGHVDSITSTDFLVAFNEAKEAGGFNRINIDMKKMQYISSAGLRVLLIMKKSIPSGEVNCIGANAYVKEIFETTGFEAVVNVL